MEFSEMADRLVKAEKFLQELHNPFSRDEIEKVGDWSIRTHHWEKPSYGETVEKGGFHIQLWHEGKRISIITPSSMTQNHFDVAFACGCHHKIHCLQGLICFIRVKFGIDLPSMSKWGCYLIPPKV